VKVNDFAAGTVTIMDAQGKVVDRVAPEHFYRRQQQEKKRPFQKIIRMSPEARQERARNASNSRWARSDGGSRSRTVREANRSQELPSLLQDPVRLSITQAMTEERLYGHHR
jgi:hypothetical protein